MPEAIDARALAKASGAAQRAYGPVADLVRIAEDLPLHLRRQAVAIVEELDLFRHFLREATLDRVIARNEVVEEPETRRIAKAASAKPIKKRARR